MGKRCNKCIWLLVVVIILLGVLSPVSVQAKTTPNNNIGFSVVAQLPDNQIDMKNSFFDLKMKSGQQQTLKVKIYNATKRDIKVKTGLRTAYTNNNGVIEYMTPATKFDSSLRYRLDKVTQVEGDSVVTVPANDSKVVMAKVKMPTTNFEGVMLGGWYFRKVDEKVTSNVKESLNVKNQYAYVIGMKYSFGKAPQPELTLTNVTSGLENYRQSIFVNLRNPSAVIIPDVKLTTVITNRATKKLVKSVKKSDVQMAPNSGYQYPILTGNTGLKAGKYHLRMVAKNKAHQWVFEKDFAITAKEAKKYARESVDPKVISPYWFVLIGALLMLIVGGLLAWLVIAIKKRNQTD